MIEFQDKDKIIKEKLQFIGNELQRIGTALSDTKPLDFLNTVEQLEIERSAFISKYRTIPLGCESFFVVLRKWNSYTPSLPLQNQKKQNINQYSIGGGYFLFIQEEANTLKPGYGLVIDPGYNFIHNFGLAGFCLDDINGILITHAHNDHTNDFESILSLLYQRNNKRIGNKIPKKVDLFFNVGSFKKFSNYLDLANKDKKNYIGNVIVMSPGQIYKIPGRDNIDCKILTLFTNHHEIVTADYSLGICFKLSDRSILLTGDTGWSYEISEKNQSFLRENDILTKEEGTLNSIDVLISHIGTIKREEFNYLTEETSKYFYDKHLGIKGTLSIIEQWKPELCVVSEFGEELNSIRETLIREIEITGKKFYNNLVCIPGDIGLFIFLDSKKTLCYLTGELISWDQISYKDILDEMQQREIKYYSDTTLSGLANKEGTLTTLKIIDGLRYYKKYYMKEIIDSFKLEVNTKENIIKEIANIFIDYSEPWDIEDSEEQVIGRLMLLSCILDNPIEAIDALRNGYNVFFISDFLDTYLIDTSKIRELAFICANKGIDNKNRSVEEELIYNSSVDLINEFLNNYIKPDKDNKQLDLILKKINDFSISDVWNTLHKNEKIKVLFFNYNENEIKGVILDKDLKQLFEYIKKFKTITNNLSNTFNTLFENIDPGGERCWQYWPDTDIKSLRKEMKKKSNTEKKEQFTELIEAKKKIIKYDDHIKKICHQFNPLLSNLLQGFA